MSDEFAGSRPGSAPQYDPNDPLGSPVPPPATHPTGTGSGSAGSGNDDRTRDVAAGEAKSVAADARAGGQQVAETAKQQAGEVLGEAKMQARQLFEQARTEFTGQSSSQQQRVALGLHSLADELRTMADAPDNESGLLADLARQGEGHARTAASWLEQREPGDVVAEVKAFARRRPGTFLAGAALLGLIGGRLTRSLADQARQDDTGTGTSPTPAPGAPVGTDPYPAPVTPAVDPHSTAHLDPGPEGTLR